MTIIRISTLKTADCFEISVEKSGRERVFLGSDPERPVTKSYQLCRVFLALARKADNGLNVRGIPQDQITALRSDRDRSSVLDLRGHTSTMRPRQARLSATRLRFSCLRDLRTFPSAKRWRSSGDHFVFVFVVFVMRSLYEV
jgi:hypothetical protein